MLKQQQQHQQFMTLYSNYSNCSDCYYTNYMMGESSNNISCIRKQPFNQEYIDSYMQKNKNKVKFYFNNFLQNLNKLGISMP